ncbi:MAG: ATP synthase F0 subunit B [Candidatus Peribacteria bacterium]|nr:MAG: ATP synthase F0 subunit B [Candidatus Peribacteria bacterium]
MNFINWSVLLAQLVNFGILFFVFKHFVGDKLSQAIVERRALHAQTQQAQSEYQNLLDQAHEEKKQIINEGLEHKAAIVQEAELVAQNKAAHILAQAEKEAAQMEHSLKERASALENELKNQFVAGVKATSQRVVNKLLDQDVSLQEQYLEKVAAEFMS